MARGQGIGGRLGDNSLHCQCFKPPIVRLASRIPGKIGAVDTTGHSFFVRVVVVKLDLNRWLVLGFFAVPTFTLDPSISSLQGSDVLAAGRPRLSQT